jgi:sn-glycerol 3-phosphate transport system substrate-binding protein
MNIKQSAIFAAVAALIGGTAGSANAVTEIQFWHAMGGANGDRINQIAENFNQSQSAYKVVPVFKGTYPETMTAGIAAFRAGKAPHILMVFEVGTGTMMAAKGAIVPVYKLMADTGVPFDPKGYNPAVTGYYSSADGKMLSMPFASSTPVMWYNKDAFVKAGLDPNKPPKTWPEVGEYGKKLVASGLPCGFSTSWFTWVLLENFSAWHNVPFGTKSNGLGGLDAKYTFNGPLQVRMIQQLADWQKDKTFVYTGRDAVGEPRFTSGDCGMFLGSSAGYGGIKAGAKFAFAAAAMPYWPDVKDAPQNSIIGGNSLWVMSGHSKAEDKGVAEFFRFLSLPIIQSYWHAYTGYVPITNAAYEDMKSVKFYDSNPGRDIPILELANKKPTENSMGLRFGYLPQARDIMYEDVENVFNGKMTAQQGLDDAVKRGDELLRKFEEEHK